MTAVDMVHRKGHDLSEHTIREELEGKSVPLHRLPEYRCVDRGWRQGDGEFRSRVNRSQRVRIDDLEGPLMYEFKIPPAGDRTTGRQSPGQETKDAKLIGRRPHPGAGHESSALPVPPHLVDLSHIEGLDAIEMKGPRFGDRRHPPSMPICRDPSAIVGEAIPALAELAGMIGDPRGCANKGTIGGSLANNDPTADYPAGVPGASAPPSSPIKRRLKPEEFFQGLFTTALESDEIITRVMFSAAEEGGLHQIPQPGPRATPWSACSSAKRAVGLSASPSTGAGSDGVFRVASFEEALKKRFSPKGAGWSQPACGWPQ